MITLIAESKTMTACDSAVDAAEYAAHTPLLEADADAIMESLRGHTAAGLAAAVKISDAMARRLHAMIYDFPDKRFGARAIEAFTGVVFKALGYDTLDFSEQHRICSDVRIISSLYGFLRPDDIVKSYRFDFTTRLAPGGDSFAAYWRRPVTDCLLDEMAERGETTVLDLMPGDAARCLDLKRVGEKAKIVRAVFRRVMPGGEMKTPDAGRLKTLRGQLLRELAVRDIRESDELLHLSTDHFMVSGNISPKGEIEFLTT